MKIEKVSIPVVVPPPPTELIRIDMSLEDFAALRRLMIHNVTIPNALRAGHVDDTEVTRIEALMAHFNDARMERGL